MIGSLRNFAKSKFAGLLVFIMIIPFVFWGMGGMFSSGNTNNIAKINKTNISTQEFIEYLNGSGIPQEYIRENLEENIIQELLSALISSSLLKLEIKDLDIIISEKTLLNQIKKNKNFLNDSGVFQRTKYEKFLLENNQTASGFEKRLKEREAQKNLFDYIGAGTISPNFLTKKLFIEENKKLEIEFINLKNFYDNKEKISDEAIYEFISENNETLKVEYIDFDYIILNPKNLVGIDEFNQAFFDKIDEIEVDISNEISFDEIVSKLDIKKKVIKNFRISKDAIEVEKKIFELKNNKFDIFENKNDFIVYNINNIEERRPDLKDKQTKDELIELLVQKRKFEYNQNLINRINSKDFGYNEFLDLGKKLLETTKLNSVKDNNKFDINSVELLYSLPINSLTLINDEKNNIYLARIKDYEKKK